MITKAVVIVALLFFILVAYVLEQRARDMIRSYWMPRDIITYYRAARIFFGLQVTFALLIAVVVVA